MTFEEWWTQRETAAFNSLAGADNASAAWDYQQQRIDKLEKALLEAADIIDTNTNFHPLAETLRILAQEQE